MSAAAVTPSRGRGRPGRPIVCLDTDARFGSVKAAAGTVGRHPTSLIAALKRGTSCGGRRFAYADGKDVPPLQRHVQDGRSA